MLINTNHYSLAEMLEMVRVRNLIVNRDYQRGSRIWPNGARSYFIDTILSAFPFPKIYIYEYTDRADAFAIKRELVDGQQRLFTIQDFRDDRFAISGESQFKGLKFSELPEEQQQAFLSYTASVDVIRNASRAEILQMFRRMNAYTLPLNEAEKRHSSFDGEFKWFVNQLADDLNEFFVEFGVFTSRQIVRMADAELIAEIILSIEDGVVSTSPTNLRELYKKHDDEFHMRDRMYGIVKSAFEFAGANFQDLKKTFMAKPYALHMLIVGLIQNQVGLEPLSTQIKSRPIGRFCRSPEESVRALLELSRAHEAKESEGPYTAYVWGASEGTNRQPRRLCRLVEIMNALGNPVEERLDAETVESVPASVRESSRQVALSIH